jgi:hypothetical protein
MLHSETTGALRNGDIPHPSRRVLEALAKLLMQIVG